MLIYGGEREKEVQQVVNKVLQQCVQHGLAVNLLKSKFHVKQTIFLVHINNGQEIQMDTSKVDTMSK